MKAAIFGLRLQQGLEAFAPKLVNENLLAAKEQGAKGKGQRAKGKGQGEMGQRGKVKGQGAKGKGQGAKGKERRVKASPRSGRLKIAQRFIAGE